jgi:hypothetical protein
MQADAVDTTRGRAHAVVADRVGPHVKQAVQYPHEGTVVRTAGDHGYVAICGLHRWRFMQGF